LLKGKKVPAVALPKSAPAAAKAAVKAAPAKLSLEEALKQSKYPGAQPRPKPKPPAKVAVHKFEKKPEYESTQFVDGISAGHRVRSEDPVRNPRGTHKALKNRSTTLPQPKAKFDESDADKLLKAMGDFTKHSSIASRFAVAYSSR